MKIMCILALMSALICRLGSAETARDAIAEESAYLLAPGDLIRVEIFGQPDLSGVVRIPSDGKVSLPLIGELPSVVGLSVALLRADLERRYKDGYLTQASINVVVQEFAPRSAYVLGQTHAQGTVELPPFSRVTAMQAISRLGGFLADANRQGTVLIRDDPARPGSKMAVPVPSGGQPEEAMRDVVLQPDDMIIVPVLGGVVVIGKVRQAGALALPGEGTCTVTKAIAMAGGFEKFARSDRVQLIRSGSPTAVIDVAGLLDGSKRGKDPVLKPGDTLFVPDSKF